MKDTEIVSAHEMSEDSWKMKTIVIGGAVGLLTGLGAASLLTRRAEEKGTGLSINPTKGIQLVVLLGGLIRSVLSLNEEK